MRQMIQPAILYLALVLAAGACASEIDGADEEPDLEESEANGPVCEVSPPDGNGGVWVNYRAQDIGCGCCGEFGTMSVNGFTIPGREKCFYQWLQSNNPDIVAKLGPATGSEFRYDPPNTIPWVSPDWWPNVAWGVPFSQGQETGFGARLQFMYQGTQRCGGLDTNHGYLKVYYFPERAAPQQAFNEKDCRSDADCPAGDDGWGHCDYDPEKAKNVCKRKRCTDENGCPAYGLHLDAVTYCKDSVHPASTYCGPSNSHQPCQGSHAQYTVTYSFWNEAERRCKSVGGLPLITCTGAKFTAQAPPPSSCLSRGHPHYDNACVAGPHATGTYLDGYDIPVNAFKCAHQ